MIARAVVGSVVLIATALVHRVSAAPLVDEQALRRAGLCKYWEANLPLTRAEAIERAYLLDNALYVTTTLGKLFAVQADVGLIRWAAPLTKPALVIFKPAHLRQRDGAPLTIVSTTETTFVIDRFTGDVVQRFRPRFRASGPAVGFGDALFMGGMDGRFYSVGWDPGDVFATTVRWEVDVGSAVTASPALYTGPRLVLATSTGRVFCCYAADKALQWSFATGGAILGDPIAEDDGVYIASVDRSLYRLDADRGWLVWRTRFPAPLAEGPVLAGHTVFQFCPGDGLSAVDADTGRIQWRVPNGRTFAAHLGDNPVIFAADGELLVVDRESGASLSRIAADGVFQAVPNGRTDAAYLLSSEGRVLCVRPAEVPYVRLREMASARERLNLPPAEDTAASDLAEGASQETAGPTVEDPFRSRADIVP